MKNKDFSYQQGKLRKFNTKQNQDEYLVFLPTLPIKFLNLFQSSSKQQSQKSFKLFYLQISGNYYPQKQYLFESYKQLIQTLNSIAIFGGSYFQGYREHQTFDGVSIRLDIKSIETISFINLKWLNFRDCSLGNIEALAFLEIKHIKGIQISNNRIVSLKSISKTCFYQLVALKLSYNQISPDSFSCIDRSHSPKLECFQSYQLQNYQARYQLSCIQLIRKPYLSCKIVKQLKQTNQKLIFKNILEQIKQNLARNNIQQTNL